VRARRLRYRSRACVALTLAATVLLAVLPPPSPAAAGPATGAAADGQPAEAVHAGIFSSAFFYRIKLAIERIRLWLTRSREAQTEYLVKLINRRSSEISEMIRTGRTKLVETAARDQEQLIEQVQDKVKGLEIGEDDIGLLSRVEEAVGRAWDTLSQSVGALPERARGAINGIIHGLSKRAGEFWEGIEKIIGGPEGGAPGKGLLERLKPFRDWPGGPPDGKGPQGK